MSAKRPPSAPGARKPSAAKAAAKPASQRVGAEAARLVPAAKTVAARGAKAVAKIKFRTQAKAGVQAKNGTKAKSETKAKVQAVAGRAPQAKRTAALAKPLAQPSSPAGVKLRPRFKQTARAKRMATKRDRQGMALARFAVGDVVRHKLYPFRGVVFDIDPVFANTDEWWLSIPEPMRPKKNQPFYHLLAENAETEYIAYVSEQNLLPDTSGVPVRHPQVSDYFVEDEDGRYRAVFMTMLN